MSDDDKELRDSVSSSYDAKRKLTPREAVRLLHELQDMPLTARGFEIEAADILSRVSDEPDEPAAVEPQDWPTDVGVWHHLGTGSKFWAFRTTKGELALMSYSGRTFENMTGFVHCNVTVPPIREPEPEPSLIERIDRHLDNEELGEALDLLREAREALHDRERKTQ